MYVGVVVKMQLTEALFKTIKKFEFKFRLKKTNLGNDIENLNVKEIHLKKPMFINFACCLNWYLNWSESRLIQKILNLTLLPTLI